MFGARRRFPDYRSVTTSRPTGMASTVDAMDSNLDSAMLPGLRAGKRRQNLRPFTALQLSTRFATVSETSGATQSALLVYAVSSRQDV